MIAMAAVLERFNSPLRTLRYPVPEALAPGSALARTEMAGICGTDVHLYRGELPIQLPVILGHETVGRLAGLGEGLERDWNGEPLSVGDRVTWNSAISCGRCYYCRDKRQPTRCPERKAYGIGYRCDQPPHFLGGYADYHYLRPGTTLFKLPSNLPTEAVIGAGCALITAIHGVERMCGAGAGDAPSEALPGMPVLPELWRDWVVIQGSGPVGLAALAVAKHAGARRVIVVGGPSRRLEMARCFGADETIDIQELTEANQRVDRIREMTGGYGADAVLECVGRPEAVAEGMAMCRDGARYLILGHYCDSGERPLNPHVVTRKQLQIVGSWSSEPRHLRSSIRFLEEARDRFPFEQLITHRVPIQEADRGLSMTERWESTKCVIVPA